MRLFLWIAVAGAAVMGQTEEDRGQGADERGVNVCGGKN